jgi:hypothetical protein
MLFRGRRARERPFWEARGSERLRLKQVGRGSLRE